MNKLIAKNGINNGKVVILKKRKFLNLEQIILKLNKSEKEA